MEPQELKDILIRSFSLNELKELCFEFNIEFSNIEGFTLNIKAQGIVEYFKHREELGLLEKKLRELRPQLFVDIKILLGEDNEDQRMLYVKTLTKKGYQVISVNSPEAVLDYLRRDHSFDIVVLDVRLSNENDDNDLSGINLARTIKSYDIPIILNTNYADAIPFALEAALKDVVSDVIKKKDKDSLNLLAQAINNVVNKKSANLLPITPKVFIGHGGVAVWEELLKYLKEELNLQVIEFNSESVAGQLTTNRLYTMLKGSNFAFLIMTAEHEHKDQTWHASENVIHEIGLFQAYLGVEKAIVMLEHGCNEFSNIAGVGQIRFHRANFLDGKTRFEIARVLRREGILFAHS